MDTTRQIDKSVYNVSIEKQPLSKTKSFLGVEYDTWTLVIGFLIPLISFFLGFILTIVRDRVKEKSNLKIASDSFLMWINKTIKSSNLLLTELKTKKEEAEKLDGFQVSRPDFINLHLNRFTADQNVLYKALVKLKIGDLVENFNDYSKIIVSLDFLEDFQKMLLQNSQYIVEDFQSLFTEWNDSIRRLHKAKHNLVGKRFKEGGAMLRAINDQFNNWYKQLEPGLLNTDKFLKSLEPMLQDYYNANPADDELSELLSITQQTRTLYKKFIFERDRVSDLYSKFYKQLKETVDEIENLSNKIGNKKDKFFYL